MKRKALVEDKGLQDFCPLFGLAGVDGDDGKQGGEGEQFLAQIGWGETAVEVEADASPLPVMPPFTAVI